MPRCSGSAATSFIVTGKPALLSAQAMPPPITPAPSTAVRATVRGCASSSPNRSRRSTLRLKNRVIRLRPALLDRHSANASRSSASPSASGLPAAPRTARNAASGAAGCSRPRRMADSTSAASESLTGGITSGGAARAGGSAHSSAMAASRPSRSTQRSTSPDAAASGPLSGRPLTNSGRAACGPIRRGSRWVPPQPGMMPSVTSGSPIWVLGWSVAIRWLQASANSVPPPRQAPSITATVGTGSAWKRSNSACTDTFRHFAASASGNASSSPMSAPAMKQSGLALRTRTSRTSCPPAISASIALTTRSSSASNAPLNTTNRWSGGSNTSSTVPSPV